MKSSYLIRYGLSHQVGRFASDSSDLERGQTVVIRSYRGTELGRVLIKVDPCPVSTPASPATSPETARIIRVADPDDLERARQLELERPVRFELCRRVIEDNDGPLELIDVEPLLEDRRTVLHYLGPHQLDIAGLVATLRSTCNIEVLLEPVGRDVSDDRVQAEAGAQACGRCGSDGGGCGAGGACSTDSESSTHGNCSNCGIKSLIAARRALLER